MNITDSNLTNDLELFDKIVPQIDTTVTKIGCKKFKSLFEKYQFSHNGLTRRTELIKSIIYHMANKNTVVRELKKIKKIENSIDWFLEKDSDNFGFKYELFNTKELITTKNFFKIYSPSFIIIIYLLVYVIMRYYGVGMGFVDYFKNIYTGYRSIIFMILVLILKDSNMSSFMANLLASLYILFQVYSIYNSFDSSYSHYTKRRDFCNKFNDVKSIMKSIYTIFKNDMFMVHEKVLLKSNINLVKQYFVDKKLSFGQMYLMKIEGKFNDIIEDLMNYIGLLDAFISVTRLVEIKQFCFPKYIYDSNKPLIKIEQMWSPMFNSNQVFNDCDLDNVNCMIITGANSSGKSTYIRNVLLNVLFAQTIGVCCCKNIELSPFSFIFSYINIPNISRNNESLYQAEINRCFNYLKRIEFLKDGQFSLTVIDELFTGTTPKEGIATSYGLCEYIGDIQSNIMIVTTHFHEIADLGIKYPDKFINKKFDVYEINGQYVRPFKLIDGISDKNIAIELLYQKGYNNTIIKNAIIKYDEL